MSSPSRSLIGSLRTPFRSVGVSGAWPMSSVGGSGSTALLDRPIGQPSPSPLRRVRAVWALLVLNVLTYYADVSNLLPVPSIAGKFVTQAALVLALLLVLSVNRPAVVRPSVFILLAIVLGALALVTSFHAEFVLGATYRASRFIVFILVLWLLTPWWGRRDLLLLKAHLTMTWVILASVVAGLLIAPGLAMTEGRLTGVIWPIPPTQVAHYAAVAAGLSVVLWLAGLLARWPTVAAVSVAVPILLLTHTRTALVAVVAGVFIAGLSLFTTRRRVRKAFGLGVIAVGIGALTLSSYVATWLARGQNTEEVAALTGRREVWELILAEPRTVLEVAFGYGLSNKSYHGRPIDSNWLATYYDLGIVGVAISAALILFLLVAATFTSGGPERALALFLVAYSLVASFTETGHSDASTYFLELGLAAALLMSAARRSVVGRTARSPSSPRSSKVWPP